MEFEWDEAKRAANQLKHGLDFFRATTLFSARYLMLDGYDGPDGERREIAIGLLDDVWVAVIFTMRHGRRRVISVRRARQNERRRYQAVYGH